MSPVSSVRIDFLSPLPPVRSGIADYSLDLLPHLEALCDLRVVRLPGQPVAPEVEERFAPAPFERLGEEGRLPLYQMGNNRYHQNVTRAALAMPGVVVLHDLVLHHVLLDMTLGPGAEPDPEGYVERLETDHGWVGRAISRAKWWGGYGEAPTFELPAHRTLLRRQRGVLVHSRWAAEKIAREDPEIRVEAVEMGVPLPAAAGDEAGRARGRAFRRRLGLPAEAPVIGCFGFQTPIKRTGAAIEALAQPGLEQMRLVIVGEVSPAVKLEEAARRAGVADRVTVTGYLDFDDFEAAIAAADLCLNLRYPTAGETSASLLRILAAGRPAVVSDYAQFAELPEKIAARVPLGEEEVPALAAILRDLLSSPDRLAAMGRAAREHVRRRHDPASSARRVVEACRRWADAEPPGDAEPRVPAPTSLAWSELGGEIEIEGVEKPWLAGERKRLRILLRNRGPATWLAGRSGPGGVAVEVGLTGGGEDAGRQSSWLPLPRNVAEGESAILEVEIRRLPGSSEQVELRVEPHVLGGTSFAAVGGPVWQRGI